MIIKFLRSLFNRPIDFDGIIMPSVGETWILKSSNDDPFPPKARTLVDILEIREGWVRYDMGGVFRDERKTIEDFVRIYQKVDIKNMLTR